MSKIAKKSDEQKDAEAEVEGFRKDLGPFVVAAELIVAFGGLLLVGSNSGCSRLGRASGSQTMSARLYVPSTK